MPEKRVIIRADRASAHTSHVFSASEIESLKVMLLAIRGAKATQQYLELQERQALEKLTTVICLIAKQPWESHE